MSNDAQGIFEAEETIISAEATGKIISYKIQEGMPLQAGELVGLIDPVLNNLQKDQVLATQKALLLKKTDPNPQVKVLTAQLEVQKKQLAIVKSQLQSAIRDKERLTKLLASEAVSQKQVDDIGTQVNVLMDQESAAQKSLDWIQQQIASTIETSTIQNRAILSEQLPLNTKLTQAEEQLSRNRIINPLKGTVLTKYTNCYEVTAPGKALYKIANLDTIYLRAYINGTQLPQVRLNQKVHVSIALDAKERKKYSGIITWIADKSEFTPKTIQTQDERQNLVYAMKVAVPNDGMIKIGMYGEVHWK